MDEEDVPVELGCAQIGSPQISPQQISFAEVRAPKVGPEQVGTAKADAAQVRALELGPDQVGAAAIGSAVTDLGAHRLADPLQQRADLPPVRGGVEKSELARPSAGEAFDLLLSALELVVQLPAGWSARASARYHSISWSCRITVKTVNIDVAIAGVSRQWRPPKVT